MESEPVAGRPSQSVTVKAVCATDPGVAVPSWLVCANVAPVSVGVNVGWVFPPPPMPAADEPLVAVTVPHDRDVADRLGCGIDVASVATADSRGGVGDVRPEAHDRIGARINRGLQVAHRGRQSPGIGSQGAAAAGAVTPIRVIPPARTVAVAAAAKRRVRIGLVSSRSGESRLNRDRSLAARRLTIERVSVERLRA